jgi:hypothetical protein
MRSMGEVRVRATETVCVSKHPPHPASPPRGGEEHEGRAIPLSGACSRPYSTLAPDALMMGASFFSSLAR